jgi:hypothetical protein
MITVRFYCESIELEWNFVIVVWCIGSAVGTGTL